MDPSCGGPSEGCGRVSPHPLGPEVDGEEEGDASGDSAEDDADDLTCVMPRGGQGGPGVTPQPSLPAWPYLWNILLALQRKSRCQGQHLVPSQGSRSHVRGAGDPSHPSAHPWGRTRAPGAGSAPAGPGNCPPGDGAPPAHPPPWSKGFPGAAPAGRGRGEHWGSVCQTRGAPPRAGPTWAWLMRTGCRKRVQRTLWKQGGVVRDPLYR